MINIDALDSDDWRRWRALRLRALNDAPDAFVSVLADWRGIQDTESQWRNRLALPGSLNLIAGTSTADVGMVSGLSGEEPETVELSSMWVDPEFRRKGVADALVEAVLDFGKDQGAERVTLGVMQANPRAIQFYRRHGFVKLDRPVTRHRGGKVEQYMVRPL